MVKSDEFSFNFNKTNAVVDENPFFAMKLKIKHPLVQEEQKKVFQSKIFGGSYVQGDKLGEGAQA